MEVYDELEKALKKIERQEEKIMRLNIKNLELINIMKEVREILKKHTTKFKDIYIPASESWYLLEKIGVDKE